MLTLPARWLIGRWKAGVQNSPPRHPVSVRCSEWFLLACVEQLGHSSREVKRVEDGAFLVSSGQLPDIASHGVLSDWRQNIRGRVDCPLVQPLFIKDGEALK